MTSYVNQPGAFVWRQDTKPRPLTRRRSLVPAAPTFRRRLAAYLIDSAVVAILSCATSVAVLLPLMHSVPAVSWHDAPLSYRLAALLFAFTTIMVPAWLYFVAQECSAWRATLGKRMMNLKVTSHRGERLTFSASTMRFAAKATTMALAPFIVLSIVSVLLSQSRRALHDLLADSIVVEIA